MSPHDAYPDRGYPDNPVPVNHTEPVPRRIRGYVGGQQVLDTVRATYLWEARSYPQYYIPLDDIDAAVLVDENRTQQLSRGTARRFGLNVKGTERPAALRVYGEDSIAGLAGLARLEWDAIDAWFEEDEQVFVHPRSPYVRVDALRSSRAVRVEIDGVVLAESPAPVLVFETGLPTRYYVDRTAIDAAHLDPSPTVTACPYKGTTSGYWSARIADQCHDDVAWAYDFPTRQLQPIAGLVAFYNEKVDLFVDGVRQERPDLGRRP